MKTNLQKLLILLFCFFNHTIDALSTTSPPKVAQETIRFVILGGTGRIGTAVAIHLLQRDETCEVVLVGRRPRPRAIEEVLHSSKAVASRVSSRTISTVWEASPEFAKLVEDADCLIHVAGPYLDRTPVPLDMAIHSPRCRAYVDVSDPLPYLETSLLKTQDAQVSNLTALVAAGAFPGMSNVLAREASSALDKRVQDVRFHYFTAGLGGSGNINLYITNLGFGEPMVQYDQGQLRFFPALSGLLLGEVDFFLPPDVVGNHHHHANQLVKDRVGRRTIFAWPFPEAATVPTHIRARGNSYAAMGTAPHVWNILLGVLVDVIPRPWWRLERFSQFLADFSQPLVWLSDKFLELVVGVGETHAMRVDVTFVSGPREEAKGVSIVQAHDSFRTCVGQSCAEFALDILENPRPGVYVPEQFYDEADDRRRVIEKLTSTSGTFCYTGPIVLEKAPALPTGWFQAITRAD